MIFLLIFLVAGIITARFIERKNYHVAMTAHAVMFTVLLFFVAIMQDNKAITVLLEGIFGRESLDSFRTIMASGGAGLPVLCNALFILEAVVVLLSIIAALISVETILTARSVRRAKALASGKFRHKSACDLDGLNGKYKRIAIFRVNCRMNT